MSCLSRPRRRAARLSAFVAFLLLSATAAPALAQQCSGTPQARIEMANQTVPDHTPTGGSVVVTLDGSGSTPNGANQPSFLWTQAAGDAYPVALANASSRIATASPEAAAAA